MSLVDKSLDELVGKDKAERRSGRGSKAKNTQRGGAVRNTDRKNNQTTFSSSNRSPGRGGSPRGGGRGGRGRTNNNNREGPRNLDSQWNHNAFNDRDDEVQTSRDSNEKYGYKIRVSNLRFDVLEDELRDLFGKVGNLHTVKILYDKSGRSSGVGEVVFLKHGDAQRSIAQYNNKKIDEIPMSVTDAGTVNIGTKSPRSRQPIVVDDDVPVQRNTRNNTNSNQGARPARRQQQQWDDEDLNVDNVNFKISVDYS